MSTAALPPAFVGDVDRDARRALIEGHPTLEGIDFVEVATNRADTSSYVPGAPTQRTLLVHLLNHDVPMDWDARRVAVLGGVRADLTINPVRVVWAWPAVAVAGDDDTGETTPLEGVTDADRELVRATVPAAERDQLLVVRTSSSGDWSTYVLRLLDEGGQGVPEGFDPPLAEAPFTFTVDCPSDLDPRPSMRKIPYESVSPVLDYLARDYDALRTRLLDRVSTLLPNWTDRNPADAGVMLVELFAYLGDRLAYWQDAVAMEAYLGTAQRRTSARRHARLLDYAVHEGCSARTWLAFTTNTPFTLRPGVAVADALPPDLGGPPATVLDVIQAGGRIAETCLETQVSPDRNELPLYSWGDPSHQLPAGSTAAFLRAREGYALPPLDIGDVLVLADVPSGGSADLGDPSRRFAVRLDRIPVRHVDDLVGGLEVLEVHWSPADALRAPLLVTDRLRDTYGELLPRAVALANVVLADDGASISSEELDPPQVPVGAPYRPRLRRTGLAWVDPVHAGVGAAGAASSATAAMQPDPRRARAAVYLDDGDRQWDPQRDLIGSARLAPHFVVEVEPDGVSRLRFGDGTTGRRPAPGSTPHAWYRVGGGSGGNVAAGRLTSLVRDADGKLGVPDGAVVEVWNPLPAVGGSDPESLDAVRQLAPYAFRHQLRAVSAADYAAVASAHPGVQRAVARRRWTGSWYAQEVTVDPVAARADDPAVSADLAEVLEQRRMAGVDVELARPVYVPLEVVLTGCVAPNYLRAHVEQQLWDSLSSRLLPDGRRGFFHPDRFTFGQPLFLSDVVAAAMSVPGLSWVEITRFARAGASAVDAEASRRAGRLEMAPREVLRCDTDPNNPEAGHVEIVLRGGS